MFNERSYRCVFIQPRFSSYIVVGQNMQPSLKSKTTLQENVCGLFLVYALLNLQPYSDLACLRIVPGDMDAINHIEAKARRDKRLDVLYILGSVMVKGPVQYHADNRERGMDGAVKKYFEGEFFIDSKILIIRHNNVSVVKPSASTRTL